MDPAEVERQMLEKYSKPSRSPADVEREMVAKYTPVDATEDAAKGFGSGFIAGAGDMLDLAKQATPLGMAENAAWAVKEGGNWLFPGSTDSIPDVKLTPEYRKGISDITGGADKYEPKTTLGKYARTIGEFTPGALVPGGNVVGNVIKGAVVPGAASEAAGQFVEKTDYKDYAPAARLAAAVTSPFAAEKVARSAVKKVAPGSGVNEERLAAAKTLEDAGIKLTAGQTIGDEALLAREASTRKGVSLVDLQPEAYTQKVMSLLGSSDPLATPHTMRQAEQRISGELQRIADSVIVPSTMDDLKKMTDVIKDYRSGLTSTTDKVPDNIVGAFQDLYDAYKTGNPIPGDTLRRWRQDFGRRSASTTDPALSRLYRDNVDVIDDMVSRELKRANRDADWSALKDARRQYRDWMAVHQASLKADNGILNPKDVFAALRGQDKRALATGRRNDIGDITYAATRVMNPPKRVPEIRGVSKLAELAKSAIGGGAGAYYGSMLGPTGTILGATAGMAVPAALRGLASVERSALMSKPMQKYLKRQSPAVDKALARPSSAPIDALKAGVITAKNEYEKDDGRPMRASGGRVGTIAHEDIADRLVAEAERAKKLLGKSTEALLQTPDEMIAKALSVAGKGI